MEASQFETAQQPAQGSGETVWSLFWFVVKWVFFVFLIYMGMKYFYDMNRKKQAAEKIAEQKKSEEEPEDGEDQDDRED